MNDQTSIPKTYPQYSVEPGAQCPGFYPPVKEGQSHCAICWKACNIATTKHWALLALGGGTWGGPADDLPDDPGFMGWFPIGNDCHKKYFVGNAPAASLPPVAHQMANTLRVLILTPATLSWLGGHDPMALRQAREALIKEYMQQGGVE